MQTLEIWKKEKFYSYNIIGNYYSSISKTALQLSVGVGYATYTTVLSEVMGQTKLALRQNRNNVCSLLVK